MGIGKNRFISLALFSVADNEKDVLDNIYVARGDNAVRTQNNM